MLCAISAVLEVPVTALLGEKAADGNEEPTLTDSEKLDRIAEKLEAVNAQLARQSAQKRKLWRVFFFLVAAACVLALFIDVMQLQYIINTHFSLGESSSIGIIGGADGPTAVFVGRPADKTSQIHMASSSMRFEHADEVEWRLIFLEKLHEDITIQVV